MYQVRFPVLGYIVKLTEPGTVEITETLSMGTHAHHSGLHAVICSHSTLLGLCSMQQL